MENQEMNPATLILIGVFLILAGAFCAYGGIKKPDYFINHRKAKKLVAVFGEKGAGIFYTIAGLAFIVGGIVAIAASLAL